MFVFIGIMIHKVSEEECSNSPLCTLFANFDSRSCYRLQENTDVAAVMLARDALRLTAVCSQLTVSAKFYKVHAAILELRCDNTIKNNACACFF